MTDTTPTSDQYASRVKDALMTDTINLLRTLPDRSLEDSLHRIAMDHAAHSEIDCDGGGEYPCDSCAEGSAAADAIRVEIAYREANGIRVDDPYAETFEQRYAPYGTAWQEEQIDRAEGRG